MLLVAFVLFLAGCQSQPAQKVTERKYPSLWCDYRSPEVFHLSDAEYRSAAEKYAKAKYGAGAVPDNAETHLSFPDVLPERRAEYPYVLAMIEVKRVKGKDYDTVSQIEVCMSSDSSLLEIGQGEADERITNRHGSPW
jgi:hypothetical protein